MANLEQLNNSEPMCGGILNDLDAQCAHWSDISIAEAPILANECRTHGGEFNESATIDMGKLPT